MFTAPRTWKEAESAIRHESFNASVPGNLDAFKSLMTKRVGIATKSSEVVYLQRGSNTTTVSSTNYFDGGTIGEDNLTDQFAGGGLVTTAYSPTNPPCVLWVPFKALNAAKKSSESIYIQVRLNAQYVPIDPYNNVYPVTGSLIEYEYLGSEADSSPASGVFSSLGWSSTLSSNTRSNGRIYLATEESLLDTSAMSTTNVSLAAFRFRLKQYVIPLTPPPSVGPRIFYFPGSDVLTNFLIRVDVVVK